MEKKETFDFESQLKELDTLVNQMEKGNLSLEESLALFEQGIKLTRDCQKALKKAEQKVQILVEKNNTEELTDYNEPE